MIFAHLAKHNYYDMKQLLMALYGSINTRRIHAFNYPSMNVSVRIINISSFFLSNEKFDCGNFHYANYFLSSIANSVAY